MEERKYKDDLKMIILDMAQRELDNYEASKAIKKYFEGNLDKIINENIKKLNQGIGINKVYSKVLIRGSKQENMSSIAKIIK